MGDQSAGVSQHAVNRENIMSQENETQAVDEFELEHFERNRYFQGKLMTAHDMATEQEYHSNRLETTNRLVSGSGIVSGLSVTEFEYEDGELQVTIAPGVAIDDRGRPIVVRTPTTRTIPMGDSDHVYLYLVYGEEPKDPVPVPGVEATNGEESEESRILEIFELRAKDTPPASSKTPPVLDLPEIDETDEYTEIANKIVDSYHETYRQETEGSTEAGIFLGAFERTPDDTWEVNAEETRRRDFVYDNDMLFSMVFSLLVASDGLQNPDDGPAAEMLESELDQINEFSNQLQNLEIELAELHDDLEETTDTTRQNLESKIEVVEEDLRTSITRTESELQNTIDETESGLQREVDELQEALRTQAEFNAYRSLNSAIDAYEATAETFEHHGEVSKKTQQIIKTVRQGIADEVDRSFEQYQTFVGEITEEITEFVEILDGNATDESFNQFTGTVDRLQETQSGETTFVDLVTTFDRVSQSAQLLEPRYEISPE